jgi:hypothetical protein
MNNDELVYKQKYLKYKQKYLQLKQMGGDIDKFFIDSKKELLTELKKHNNKLLFPTSVITSMKEQTLSIYKSIEKYNDCLDKIRNLYNDLTNLTKWGLLNDSYLNWKFSVKRNIFMLDSYFKEIIDDIKKNVKPQCGLDIEKLSIYTTIIKKNKKYIWTDNNDNKVYELTQQSVRELLPRCINGNMKLDEVPTLKGSDDLS